MKNSNFPLRRVRSFVRRDSRMTDAQRNALEKNWPQFGAEAGHGIIDFSQIFQREAPCVLEIGFGSGASLLAAALLHPEYNFIGIETHQPGIGALLLGMEIKQINNIRVYYADAVDVLKQCIPDNSLHVVQIFFPDPWPKRRHHKRRLIQTDFINLVLPKLKSEGTLHLATDWQDYAKQMMKVLTNEKKLVNLAGIGNFSKRSPQRPVITKFERRSECSGHEIYELQFKKC
jgi:tRNA (guanine-N7-)-methyltransferase